MPIPELVNFRAKYPQYNDLDDLTLATKLAEKYPAYADLPEKVKADTAPVGLILLKNLKEAGKETYREGIAPIVHGASTFAAGIPKLVAIKTGAKDIIYPEQRTVAGKTLRGISEIAGFTAGLPGRAALLTSRAIGAGAGRILPKIAGKQLLTKIAQGAGAGAVGLGLAGDTLENRKQQTLIGATIGGAIPITMTGGKIIGGVITKTGRWVARNIGGITDATINTIKRLGADRVFDPLKAKADYISQNIAPKIYDKFIAFKNLANSAYKQAINSAPKGKQIDIRPAIEKAGNRLKKLGLITKTGNLTELGKSEIARDNVYGKLLDFYQSANAISGVEKLQNIDLTQSQMIKASRAMKETLVNKEQFTFLRDKLNALYKNKPSDVDVSKVANEFYQAGEKSGMKGLQQARELQRKFFEIEDEIDINKITRKLIKAKNPQWSKIIQKEYQDLVNKGILDKQDYQDLFDDLMAHFANSDFELVSEIPGAGGGIFTGRSGLIRAGISKGTKQYYKNVLPKIEKLKGLAELAKERFLTTTKLK